MTAQLWRVLSTPRAYDAWDVVATDLTYAEAWDLVETIADENTTARVEAVR